MRDRVRTRRLWTTILAAGLVLAATARLPERGALAEQPPGAAQPPPRAPETTLEQARAELDAQVRTALGPSRSWPPLQLPPSTADTDLLPTAPGSGRSFDTTTLIRMMLADTEDVWHEQLRLGGRRYREPILVLYTGSTFTACGAAQSRIAGPFYCEIDGRLYLDLAFFEDLRARHRVAGDMAQFYVIAHEIGHHVQRLLGILEAAGRLEARLDAAARNALSVRLELQADCLAGLVVHHVQRTKQRLETGDVEIGLTTASALGADRYAARPGEIQQPETFTHGTAEQRAAWFRRGLDSGDMAACDSFTSRAP